MSSERTGCSSPLPSSGLGRTVWIDIGVISRPLEWTIIRSLAGQPSHVSMSTIGLWAVHVWPPSVDLRENGHE